MSNIKSYDNIFKELSKFKVFVNSKDGKEGPISFRNSRGFLALEEDFKTKISENVRETLNYDRWDESWVGTGKISKCAIKALNKCGNLVYSNQEIHFRDVLDKNNPKYNQDAERVIYDIYANKNCSEKVAFENAVKVFGAKYDLIAFLFFVKDDTRFLPICPGPFENAFRTLGINYNVSNKCSWENYKGFIEIIDEIRSIIDNNLEMEGTPRLIDAHSFVWIIQRKDYQTWNPNKNESSKIEDINERINSGSGKKKTTNVIIYERSQKVVDETKRRANGFCQLCNNPAPFIDNEGKPYLEAHHVKWLSRGGEDSTNNTVALCPNCHKRMHILDDNNDVNKLLNLLKKY